jgi:hypothetical protein
MHFNFGPVLLLPKLVKRIPSSLYKAGIERFVGLDTKQDLRECVQVVINVLLFVSSSKQKIQIVYLNPDKRVLPTGLCISL